MRRACFTIMSGIAVGLLLITSTSAFDLTTIERKIAKLPELKSPQPLYCLLVFGPDAKTRVWLVRDGDVLYADRNANGDLTEPGERIEADAKVSQPAEGILRFHVGDIADGGLVHKALGISWFNVDHLKGSVDFPEVTARFETDPQFRAVSLHCDVAMPEHRGTGIDGRVPESVTIGDADGLLDFASRPGDAPVLHFGGPWQITVSGKSSLRIGRNEELCLEIGTPGLGTGTTVSMAYERVIPSGIQPHVDFKFARADGTTIARSYNLKRRCCQVNLYDEIPLPAGVSPGSAEATISFDAWSHGQVSPTTHTVEILPAIPGPKLLPVSARLKSKLQHLHPDGGVGAIKFSPDGTRLIASDYPGGVIHIWELAGGKPLVTVDTTEGLRTSFVYYQISPDWQRIYTATHNRGTFDRVERDGKPLNRVTYSDAVHVWDAKSGERLHTWQQDPPRGILSINLVPDGRQLVVLEETPAEFESSRPRAVSLLDTISGQYRQVIEAHAYVQVVRDDNLAAVSLPQHDNSSLNTAAAFIRLPEWQETNRIPLGDLQRVFLGAFAAGGKLVIGEVITYDKLNDWQNFTSELKVWDVVSGKELHSLRPKWPRARLTSYHVSPGGTLAVLTEFDQKSGQSRLMLLDLTNWQVVEIPCDDDTYNRGMAFHPSGKWLAVSQMIVPRDLGSSEPAASTLQQPRIQLIDTTSGQVLETMIAPQSYQMSIAYSPDGLTLATGGSGAVLLWDMTTPPGEAPAQPVVGQTVELAGATVDGKPLDPVAYHGKVTLVSFWATWCQPCVAEMPELKNIYHKLHERGFEVVGVSVDEHGGGEQDVDLAAFVKNQSLPWAVLHGDTTDNSGMRHPLAQKLGVTSVPRSFLLDGAGKIVAIDPTLHELEKLVEPLLQK